MTRRFSSSSALACASAAAFEPRLWQPLPWPRFSFFAAFARLLLLLVRLLLRSARREALRLGRFLLRLEPLSLFGFLRRLPPRRPSPPLAASASAPPSAPPLARAPPSAAAPPSPPPRPPRRPPGGAAATAWRPRPGTPCCALRTQVVAHERHRLAVRAAKLRALQQQEPHRVQLVAVRRVQQRGDVALAVGSAARAAAVADGDAHHVLQIRAARRVAPGRRRRTRRPRPPSAASTATARPPCWRSGPRPRRSSARRRRRRGCRRRRPAGPSPRSTAAARCRRPEARWDPRRAGGGARPRRARPPRRRRRAA